MEYSTNSKISDLGEFQFINKILIPLFNEKNIGDDVAYIETPSSKLVITTDAGPSAVDIIPDRYKYYNQGWLLAVANVSDLASAAAKPLGISSSIDIPGDLIIKNCIDFFKGYKDACDDYKINITGGNIRERSKFSSHATIIGYLDSPETHEIRRDGVKENDLIYLLGKPAVFVINYLEGKELGFENLSDAQQKYLLMPRPKLFEMISISKQVPIVASSDISDSLLGSIQNLIDASKVGFIIKEEFALNDFIISASEKCNIDPLNLFNFWGDWNIVLAINRKHKNELESFCKRKQININRLGHAIKGNTVVYKSGKHENSMNIIRNENFNATSYNLSIKNNIEYMLKSPIIS